MTEMDVGSAGLSLLKAAESGVQSTDKMVNLLSGLCPFWGLEKMAVDACVEDIRKSNLSMEAKAIAIMSLKDKFRELKNQMAISDIAHKAAKEGTDFSIHSKVDDDWLSRFMDAGKHVSDEEVQVLWGNILASEFEEPESTPPSVIRILSEITPKYAKAFSYICSLSVIFFAAKDTVPGEVVEFLIVPFDYLQRDKILDLSVLTELELLGLIKVDCARGYIREYPFTNPYTIYIKYGDDIIGFNVDAGSPVPLGCILLTEAGQCISKFVNKSVVPGYLNTIKQFFVKRKMRYLDKFAISIKELGEGKDREYSFEMLPRESQQTQVPQ